MGTNSDDPELVQRVSEGDVPAYHELVRRHGAKLKNYAGRLLRDPAEAEDVVQETFLTLWRRAGDYEPKARVTTWLHRIAHNHAIDRLRARGRLRALDEHDVEPVSAAQPALLEDKRRIQAVDAALATLPERQAAALVLIHFHELSGAEACEVMGIGREALESLLARGRRTLRRALAKKAVNES